jgi:cytidine deaminase
MTNLSAQDHQLIEQAKQHIKSHFKEGLHSIAAIVLCKSGNTYTGLNFKYRTRGISMCAERIALFKAIEAGEELETMVGVKYEAKTDEYEIMNTCGECRQVELYHKPLNCIINDHGKLKKIPIEELLPFSFL